MKSTASCNKAMLINQASMPVCIDGRKEDLFSIYVSNMALKILYAKIKFGKIFENYSRMPNICGGLENSLKCKKRWVGLRVRG